MNPEFDSLLYPDAKMRLMRRAMSRVGLTGVPTNRDERRRLNAELRKLGVPELQVATPHTSEKYRHAPEQDPITVELD